MNHFFATQRRELGPSAVMWSKVMFDFRSAEVEIRRRAQAIDDFEIPRGLAGDVVEPETLSEAGRRGGLGPEAQEEFRAESARQPVDDLQPMSGLEARREPTSPQVPASPRRPPFLGRAEDEGEEASEATLPQRLVDADSERGEEEEAELPARQQGRQAQAPHMRSGLLQADFHNG